MNSDIAPSIAGLGQKVLNLFHFRTPFTSHNYLQIRNLCPVE